MTQREKERADFVRKIGARRFIIDGDDSEIFILYGGFLTLEDEFFYGGGRSWEMSELEDLGEVTEVK